MNFSIYFISLDPDVFDNYYVFDNYDVFGNYDVFDSYVYYF